MSGAAQHATVGALMRGFSSTTRAFRVRADGFDEGDMSLTEPGRTPRGSSTPLSGKGLAARDVTEQSVRAVAELMFFTKFCLTTLVTRGRGVGGTCRTCTVLASLVVAGEVRAGRSRMDSTEEVVLVQASFFGTNHDRAVGAVFPFGQVLHRTLTLVRADPWGQSVLGASGPFALTTQRELVRSVIESSA